MTDRIIFAALVLFTFIGVCFIFRNKKEKPEGKPPALFELIFEFFEI